MAAEEEVGVQEDSSRTESLGQATELGSGLQTDTLSPCFGSGVPGSCPPGRRAADLTPRHPTSGEPDFVIRSMRIVMPALQT